MLPDRLVEKKSIRTDCLFDHLMDTDLSQPRKQINEKNLLKCVHQWIIAARLMSDGEGSEEEGAELCAV